MIDLFQYQDSIIHQMNARVKLIFTLVFIFCLNLTPSGVWPAYIIFLTMICVELVLAQISPTRVLKRSLVSLPFILAALPLLFTGPEPHLTLVTFERSSFFISQPGLIRFISVLFKSWMSVLIVVIMMSTTKFEELLLAFRQIGIPKIFVSIISLMWRYLSLLVEEAKSLMKARDSRSGRDLNSRHPGGNLFWRANVTGKMAGNLLLRSIERSDRIYVAMLSRGYNGEPLVEKETRLSSKDRVVTSASSAFSIIVLILAFLLQS